MGVSQPSQRYASIAHLKVGSYRIAKQDRKHFAKSIKGTVLGIGIALIIVGPVQVFVAALGNELLATINTSTSTLDKKHRSPLNPRYFVARKAVGC
jgi:hypothetical protein